MKSLTINGLKELHMPIIGLGTWCSTSEEIENSVRTALDCGYRHIDTAFNYNNEESIGAAVKKWISDGHGTREDLFITTKLPSFGNRAEDVEKYLKMSLSRLQLDYVDLYLIHMPFAFVCDELNLRPLTKEDGDVILDYNNNINTWMAMEEQVYSRLTKAIGLSNFNAKQIKSICNKCRITPAVLQVEMHAYLQQKELMEFCKKQNIAITAYAPLGSPAAAEHFIAKYNYSVKDVPALLNNPIVNNIASNYSRTSAQILLKYLVQQDIIVIPKSANPQRIKANIDIFDFELAAEDMKALGDLDKKKMEERSTFFFKGVEKHPEYPFQLTE